MTVTSASLAVVAAPAETLLESPTTHAPTRVRPTSGAARLLPDLAACVIGAATVSLTVEGQVALVLGLPLVWLALVAAGGGYIQVPGTAPGLPVRAVLRAAAGLGVVAWAVAAVAPATLVTRSDVQTAGQTVLLVAALMAMLTLAFRIISNRATPYAPTRVVVVGDPAGVGEMLREMRRAERRGAAGFTPVGVCVTTDGELADCDVRRWSGLDRLDDAISAGEAQAVILVPGPHADHHEIRRVAARLHDTGVSLLLGSGLRDVTPARLGLGAAGGLGLLHVRPAPASGPRRLLKSIADRAGAALLLLVASPALLAIAIAVRIDTPGPAIFRQTRVGRHGREFTMLKFRTMGLESADLRIALTQANESDHAGVLFKIRRDPRITRVGALLRRYSCDELPQLVNVLRGEMSLVGPRPALPAEVAAYCPDMRRRLVVRPGLTGLWQVSGRSDLPWDETVRLDLQYVDNWSLSLDLMIALRTAGAVLGHRGAY